MMVKVKTQDDRTFAVEVPTSCPVQSIKEEVERLDGQIVAERHRVLFQGRFLEDEMTASSCGVDDGHTVLLVPKPLMQGRRGHRRSSSTGGSQNSPMRRVPPEVVRFLQAQRHVLSLLQPNSQRNRSENLDEEMGNIPGIDPAEIDATVMEPREGEGSDVALGFAFGFLLGPVAGLCLLEAALSRKLRLGMLVGIVSNVFVAVLKMATHVPGGV